MEKIRIKREYQSWVAKETLEDYSLRYAARSFRQWSPMLLANTALGGISFLALEAIGASLLISYGFASTVAAIVVVSLVIFVVSTPIAYYASMANVDIDLLTRGAGFGYIGSAISSLVYASFTFIFFALEAVIMAQALEMYFGLHIVAGYLLSSIVVIPVVFFGVTAINQLQLWTQPLWVSLMLLPLVFILAKDPEALQNWSQYVGVDGSGGQFDILMFGAASGVLFSLSAQIGEQVDYLRFLPDKTPANKTSWWISLLMAGPGWILVGGFKLLAGSFLCVLLLNTGADPKDAVEPIQMYTRAYEYVFDSPHLVMAVAALFVIVSQVKINVTNAYAGSLAWSNIFFRLTHYHPGRVVWLVFNVMIALMLILLGIFDTLEIVLSVYSNVAAAWIGALFADLAILKPAGISPKRIEFKRANLYDFNPVGCGALLLGSLLSTAVYAGLLGPELQVFAAFIALGSSCFIAIIIAIATGGRYYIARPADSRMKRSPEHDLCCVCELRYEQPDMVWCPFHQGPICSLCCGLDNHCHDICKVPQPTTDNVNVQGTGTSGHAALAPHFGRRLGRFSILFCILAAFVGVLFLMSYRLVDLQRVTDDWPGVLMQIYAAMLVLLAISAWWIVLSQENRELAEGELTQSLHHLDQTRRELVESEKMASLAGLVAGIAHEINTPIGITVSAATYLQQQTNELSGKLATKTPLDHEITQYLERTKESTRLIVSSTTRASKLVHSLKQLAVDQVSDERRHFDLRTYLDEILLSLRPKLKDLQHNVSIECQPGLDLDSYPGPFSQIITNLLINALQHAFAENQIGQIRIAVCARSDDRIELQFSDNGAGIPPEHRERVFEPFFTTKRAQGGSGLGLYLVYNLVTHKLGGSIELADDGAHKGSTFIIVIPLMAPEHGTTAN